MNAFRIAPELTYHRIKSPIFLRILSFLRVVFLRDVPTLGILSYCQRMIKVLQPPPKRIGHLDSMKPFSEGEPELRPFWVGFPY